MPRKKKEDTIELESEKKPKARKTAEKTKTTTKTTKKSTTTKKVVSEKKATVKKTTSKETSSKKSAPKTKKATTKKATARKTTTRTKKSSVKKASNTFVDIVEYYDLPYRYNQTLVKVLYQTPNTLFIYWDISDEDRSSFVKQYGINFFDDTKPVLVIHNITMNYSFEIEIDDFANSWYLQVKDANCEYSVELGRRPKLYDNNKKIEIQNDYLFITYSNQISIPNDHVLFDKNINTVLFRNIKTSENFEEEIRHSYFIEIMKKLFNLTDVKNIDDFFRIKLTNPSSLSSSNFKI